MDRYRDVGYTIETREYDMEFDEAYIDELNTLVLFNYLTMKNNLDTEHNKPVDVINFKKKRILKPKFIQKVVEDFVYDYDIPEVELRQIFNEEISKSYATKGQGDDEVKAAIERALEIEFWKERQREIYY